MKVFFTIAMLASGAVMLRALPRHKRGMPRAKPVAVAGAVLALLFALLRGVTPNGGATFRPEWEERYRRARAWKLGKYLAQAYPGSKALIIVRPQMPRPPELSAEQGNTPRKSLLVEGLREGFGESITVVDVVAPELPARMQKTFERAASVPPSEDPDGMIWEPAMMMEDGDWLTATSFDKLVQRYKSRCDLIVTTTGLPRDITNMTFWRMRSRPKLAVAVANGPLEQLRVALEKKAVSGLVTLRPNAVFDGQKPPEDLEEVFAKRYLLVTGENVGTILAQHGNLFLN